MTTQISLFTASLLASSLCAFGASTPPSITAQPTSTSASVGSTATFKVTVSGSSTLKYQWRFNDAPIAAATNAQLTLSNVQLSQAGAYSVRVTNAYGAQISSNAVLDVGERASILTQPQGASVISGDTVTFTVAATGTPTLRYQWFFNGNVLIGATDPQLILANVAKTAEGKYKVSVYNAYGNQESVEVSLSVYARPAILEQPQDAHAAAAGQADPGESVAQFRVVASGDNLRYRWFHDSVELFGQTDSTLLLSAVSVADAGQYWAEVSNDAGREMSTVVTLTVIGITEQPQSQVASPLDTVVLSVNAIGPELHCQWTLNGELIRGATAPSLTLTNVLPADSGAYQAIVFNSWGLVKSVSAVIEVEAPALPFADNFADRGVIDTAAGYGSGSSYNATKESGEPHPCSKRVGKSVWLTWVAPADGIAVFTTGGSAFDTALGVYTGTVLSNLVEVTTDDDSGGYHASRAMFNVLAGKAYHLCVGSLDKDGGEIALSWQLYATAYPLPIILSSPTDLTSTPGASATLRVQYQTTTPLTIQWYRNGQPIPGANQTSLQWSQLTVDDLGIYEVSLTSPEWTYFLQPWEIQFNSEGITKAGARNKLFNAMNSGLFDLIGP
jgi:hypothetical protein